MKIAVIGGGASGLVASIVAAKKNNEVHVFEKNKDTGKKLLLTGNGRCNYGNTNQDIQFYHTNSNQSLKGIINEENLKKMNDFFVDLGIVSKNKNGYLYPFSEKSTSIKSILMTEARYRNVVFRFNEEVKDITFVGNCFMVNNEAYDKVILATGSKCAPKTGSDGKGYEIARKFNHTINEVNPSLVQLVTDMEIESVWAGKRCEVRVSHYEDDCLKKEEAGEIQFTKYGLSGICIFNISRDIRIGLNKGKKEEVNINFLPWLSEDINTFLAKRAKMLRDRNITELFDGFLDYNISYFLIKYLHINPNKTWQELTHEEQSALANALICFKVPIKDTMGFVDAQTCSGGIDLKEINLNTMESLKQKGLYFSGEIIDIDGDCGGYNLTVAWITGLLAGECHD